MQQLRELDSIKDAQKKVEKKARTSRKREAKTMTDPTRKDVAAQRLYGSEIDLPAVPTAQARKHTPAKTALHPRPEMLWEPIVCLNRIKFRGAPCGKSSCGDL